MKKGFTLIELLAVIVILAIIALIATPIILNIVEDSKKQAIISSANLYIDGLVKQIATKNLTNEFNPSSCTVTNGSVSCDGQSIDYTVNGQAPTSGSITFNNGIVTGYTLAISGYTVTKNGSTITTTKGEPVPTTYTAYTTGQLLQYDPVNNTACTTGDTCYKWRVITTNDTASSNSITLQMDHNIENTVWVSQADYNNDTNYGSNGNTNKGPITALKALETATASWDDSLKLNYSYNTSTATNNYGILSCTNGTCTVAGETVTTNLKARIITGEEVSAITVAAGAAEGTNAYNWTLADGQYYYFSHTDYVLGTNTSGTGNTYLSWLVEKTRPIPNINGDSGATSNIYDVPSSPSYGYWTLSPYCSDYTYALVVDNGGLLGTRSVKTTVNPVGVRPVITIPKSVIE